MTQFWWFVISATIIGGGFIAMYVDGTRWQRKAARENREKGEKTE